MQSNASIEDIFSVIRRFLNIGDINEALSSLQTVADVENLPEKYQITVNILNTRILLELNQANEATTLIEEIIATINSETYRMEFVETQSILATSLFMQGRFNESMGIIEDTIIYVNKLNEPDAISCEEFIAELKNIRGLIYSNQGFWDGAIPDFKEALLTRKKLNHRKAIGMVLYNLANAYRYQEKIPLAISSVEDAIKSFKSINYVDGLEASYNLMRELLTQTGNDDQAFFYKQKLEELSEKVKFKNYVRNATIERNNQAREIERLNQEILQYKNEIWSMKLELNSLTDSSKGAVTFSDHIEDNAKERLFEVENELKEKSKERDKLLREIEELKSKMEEQKKKITEFEKKNQDLQYQLKELKSKPIKTDTGLKEEMAKLTDDNKQYILEIDELKKQIKMLEAQRPKDKPEVPRKLDEIEDKHKDEIKPLKQVKKEKINALSVDEKTTPKQVKKEKISSKPIIEQKINRSIDSDVISQVSPALQQRIRTSNPQKRLQDLLESSKLAENIGKILNQNTKIKLRFLAMQIGTSPAAVMEEVKKLKKVDFLDIQYDSSGDSNPDIVLK